MGLIRYTFSVSSDRTPGYGDLRAAAPQHGRPLGRRLVPALRCRGAALSADPVAGPLRREDQQPEEFARGRQWLQLCDGRSAGWRAPVSAGHPPLQGQGLCV